MVWIDLFWLWWGLLRVLLWGPFWQEVMRWSLPTCSPWILILNFSIIINMVLQTCWEISSDIQFFLLMLLKSISVFDVKRSSMPLGDPVPKSLTSYRWIHPERSSSWFSKVFWPTWALLLGLSGISGGAGAQSLGQRLDYPSRVTV